MHRPFSIGALLGTVIATQEDKLEDLQITRLRLEPNVYDRALAVKEAGFLVELSDRPYVMETVAEQLAALFPDPLCDVLESLPRQDPASHIIRPHLSQSLMPLKLVVEQKQGCTVPFQGEYNGLLVLWSLTGHCLLIKRSYRAVNGRLHKCIAFTQTDLCHTVDFKAR